MIRSDYMLRELNEHYVFFSPARMELEEIAEACGGKSVPGAVTALGQFKFSLSVGDGSSIAYMTLLFPMAEKNGEIPTIQMQVDPELSDTVIEHKMSEIIKTFESKFYMDSDHIRDIILGFGLEDVIGKVDALHNSGGGSKLLMRAYAAELPNWPDHNDESIWHDYWASEANKNQIGYSRRYTSNCVSTKEIPAKPEVVREVAHSMVGFLNRFYHSATKYNIQINSERKQRKAILEEMKIFV